MDAMRASLNLAEQFADAGRTWVELDDNGNVVPRAKDTKTRRKAAAATSPEKPTRRGARAPR
jgi:hypothetical protein